LGFFFGVPAVIRQLSLSAVFIALAVALGFALAHVPNVELITLTVFISGHFLGAMRGCLIGLCAMGLFTAFNPLGPPVPAVVVSQVTAMAAIGWTGGLLSHWMSEGKCWVRLALLGFGCTLFYDLMTNTALAVEFGLLSKLVSILIAGLTFSILHLASNLIIFAAAGPALVKLDLGIRSKRELDERKHRAEQDSK
jgi:hypothetical protein